MVMERELNVRPAPVDAAGAATATMRGGEAAGDPVETYRARILVVDDDPAIRGFLEEYLRIQGFDVVTANGGMEALARLEESQLDGVLLDVRMPGMDGIRTLRRIVARHPGLGVLMISGNDDALLTSEALSLGAFDYILKPVDFGYLMRALEKMVRIHPPEVPVGAEANPVNSDSGSASPYDLALEVCRMTRAMSPDARRSVGSRLERIALGLIRQGLGGRRGGAVGRLNEMRTLLRFAKDLGDITDYVHRHVESCLVRVRRALGTS